MDELKELQFYMQQAKEFNGLDKSIKAECKRNDIFNNSQIDLIKRGWFTPNDDIYNTKVKKALLIYKKHVNAKLTEKARLIKTITK